MRFSRGPVTACLGLTLVAATTSFACGVPDQPTYGAPSAIDGRKPPLAQSDDGGVASGTTGGGTTGAAAVCAEATFVDGGTCAVKWSVDIFPKMQTTWACGSASCHGGTTAPKFTTTDSKTTWDAMRAIKNKSTGLPYINPCSNDKKTSYIAQNFDGSSNAKQMPIAPATADEIAKVATWVACGAPFN